jgi:signal transduction histidine kinase
MRERLLLLGGRCEITGTADKGTTVIFNIPVQPEL